MIQQRTLVNNKNIYTTFRILLAKGAYESISGSTEFKDLVQNTARNEGGTRSEQRPSQLRYAKKRDLSFTIVTTAATEKDCRKALDAFAFEIANAPSVWRVEALGMEYRFNLKKRDEPKYYDQGTVVHATQKITLEEPNPNNRVEI
jgi:hypothetical protein